MPPAYFELVPRGHLVIGGLTKTAAAAILRSRLRESVGCGGSSSLCVDKGALLLRCFLLI